MEGDRRCCARNLKVQASINATLTALRAQLASLDCDIQATVCASPLWCESENLLTSVPGIGNVTARAFIAELLKLEQLDRRKLAAPGGVAPVNRDSGQLRGHRAIPEGRTSLHDTLFMGTLVAVWHNVVRRAYYLGPLRSRRPEEGCSGRLLSSLHVTVRTNTPWQTA